MDEEVQIVPLSGRGGHHQGQPGLARGNSQLIRQHHEMLAECRILLVLVQIQGE